VPIIEEEGSLVPKAFPVAPNNRDESHKCLKFAKVALGMPLSQEAQLEYVA
jgi:hypothetical protein